MRRDHQNLSMENLSHHDITIFLLAVTVLLATARLCGELAQRWGQPAILGEIFAGILLGPTVLGAAAPALQLHLFPPDGPVAVALQGLFVLAITLFMLVAGMEVDLGLVWRQGRAAFVVGVAGILVPFALGLVAAGASPALFGAKPGSDQLVFALFFATAMAITALPVIAKILLDLDLFRSEVGVVIVAAAIFNDLIGWIIFAFVLAMLAGGEVDSGVGRTALLTLLFTVFMLTVARWAINRVLPWVQAHSRWPGGVLGFALSLALLCAAFTEGVGVHAIFGSFLFGVAMGDSAHLRRRTRMVLDQFISFIFAPLFFASIGLRVDFLRSFDLPLVLLVLVIATVGKVIPCTFAARWMGFGRAEARAIGFGMNARGAMEIILGLLALEAGIIGDRLFVALVIMALVTSMSSGLLIQFAFGRTKPTGFGDYVSAKTFVPALKAQSRREAIGELAAVAAVAAELDAESTAAGAWRRELLIGSSLGNGVAAPFARIEGLKEPLVAIGLSPQGIDFDAPDGIPTRVVILLLVGNHDTNSHTGLFSSITHTFSQPRVAEKMISRVSNYTELRAFLNMESPAPHADIPQPAAMETAAIGKSDEGRTS